MWTSVGAKEEDLMAATAEEEHEEEQEEGVKEEEEEEMDASMRRRGVFGVGSRRWSTPLRRRQRPSGSRSSRPRVWAECRRRSRTRIQCENCAAPCSGGCTRTTQRWQRKWRTWSGRAGDAWGSSTNTQASRNVPLRVAPCLLWTVRGFYSV